MTENAIDGIGGEALTAGEMLALERLGANRFRSHRNQDNRAGAVFGGQVLAQALAAAQYTAPPWPAHHLASNFLRGGDCALPIDYEVETVRDGRRYAARRVVARQGDKPIFDCLCSFHDPEDGIAHQVGDIAGVPAPEDLPDMARFARDNAGKLAAMMLRSLTLPFPAELRFANPDMAFGGVADAEGGARAGDLWLRVPSAADLADPLAHQCMQAFASDYWLAAAAILEHPPEERGVTLISLGHTMWFHAPVRADEWMLLRRTSPWAGSGRGLCQAQMFDRGGRLIATVMQEASLRPLTGRNR